MKRYLIGALCGAIAFAVTYGLLIVGIEATRGRTIRLRSLVDPVLALSVINMFILLAVQGPIRNVPGEFTINLIPNIVSAGLFAMWILSTAVTRPNAHSPQPKA